MKLIRFNDKGTIKPGIFLDGQYYDCSPFCKDYDEQFFENDGISLLRTEIKKHWNKLKKVPKELSITSPVARPSKIVCIGLNYADHARETGAEPPAEPVIFLKSTSSFCGPNNDVKLPRGSVKTDWEVELAVVINKRAAYVEEQQAMEFIAGYCLHNDLSERSFQMERGGTWDKGKGCDTFGPVGPFLVTPDEISDVNNLRLWLSVNGKMMQDGNTANLIFKIPYLISYVSSFMTLLPGDILSTGTPAGVGLGRDPQVYLKPGDIMELGIDGLGSARQLVTA